MSANPYRSPAELPAETSPASPSWWAVWRHRRHMAQEQAAQAVIGRWTPVICDCRICSRWGATWAARLVVRFARGSELYRLRRMRAIDTARYRRRIAALSAEVGAASAVLRRHVDGRADRPVAVPIHHPGRPVDS